MFAKSGTHGPNTMPLLCRSPANGWSVDHVFERTVTPSEPARGRT